MEIENIRPASKSAADLNGNQEDSDSESDEDSDKVVQRRLSFVEHSIKHANRDKWEWSKEKNEAIAEERRHVIKEFMTVITKGRKCQNCQG
jgi:DNA-directed RNA polymerase I subunit RPA1